VSSDHASADPTGAERRRRHRRRTKKRHAPRLRAQVFTWWHLPLALAIGALGVLVAVLLLGAASPSPWR